MPKTPGYRQPRHILRYIVWAVTVLLTIAAFGVATPYVFLAVGHILPHEWAQFSNEGQAYGGIAAVIGMLAIVGVVASLILQTRESAANRVQMERLFHSDLLKMTFEDPDLIECWGDVPSGSTEAKKVAYVNLIFSYFFALFEIGRTTEVDLRREAAEIFTGSPARIYWPNARASWEEFAGSRASRRFVAIMDEEYRRAVASTPTTRRSEDKPRARKAFERQSRIADLAVGTACGATIAGATAAILRYSRPR